MNGSGEHDALYVERANCAIALARAARALGCKVGFSTDSAEPDWPVLFVELPTGQVGWHLTYADRCRAPDIEHSQIVWDGHDTAEKYRRLAAWAPTRGVQLVARPLAKMDPFDPEDYPEGDEGGAAS